MASKRPAASTAPATAAQTAAPTAAPTAASTAPATAASAPQSPAASTSAPVIDTAAYIAAIEASNAITKTDPAGIITFANAEFCELCGYSEAELLGQNHNIIRHPDTPRAHFAELWRTILAGRVHKGVVKNRRKDGRAFWAQTTIIPVFAGGQIAEFVAFRHDLSAQFAAQEQLLAAERLAARQSRYALLGELSARVAHQWRQPLSELVLELFLLREGSAASYTRSRKIIAQMSEMIDDLQRFGRTAERDATALSEIFKLSLSFVRLSLRRAGVRLRFKGRFDLRANVDAAALAQVFSNLIKNSIDAINSAKVRGEILIIASVQKRCEIGEIGVGDGLGACDVSDADEISEIGGANSSAHAQNPEASGEVLMVEFYDNGCGFADEAEVFNMHYSTKKPSDGSGLGLYICKQIINANEGEITTAKSPLGGAGFKIYLPKV